MDRDTSKSLPVARKSVARFINDIVYFHVKFTGHPNDPLFWFKSSTNIHENEPISISNLVLMARSKWYRNGVKLSNKNQAPIASSFDVQGDFASIKSDGIDTVKSKYNFRVEGIDKEVFGEFG